MFGKPCNKCTGCSALLKASAHKQTRAQMLLAQITNLHTESTAIQNHFLSMIYIPLAFFGVMIYYAYESSASAILFLLLPFLFSWCIFNIMKYTMKILGIGAYIRYLEEELNCIWGENTFLWRTALINTNGYPIWGILGQTPCLIVMYVFLIYKFVEALRVAPNQTISFFFVLAFLCQAVLLIVMACFTAVHSYQVRKKIKRITHI